MGGGRGKPVWKKTGVAQLTCRPHPLIHKTGPDFKGQRRARGKKTCACINVMGGRFFRASFSLITQRYHPRAWLISLYAACHAPRLFANILQVAPKILVGFFLCFWQKAESVIRSEKIILWNTSSSKILLFVLVNFWRTCWLDDFCHNYFCHKLYDFFWRGCWWCEFFCFSFAQRLLETRLFLFSPKRGKTIRRWHWEPQLLAHRVAEK